MAKDADLRCDGCGQAGSPEHIARRLRRLEWATRYRPVHIQTLLLGAFSPREDAEFLYSPGGEFRGEAAELLRAVGLISQEDLRSTAERSASPARPGQAEGGPHMDVPPAGKTREAVHAEFQQAGFYLAHVLECPLENGANATIDAVRLLRERLPFVASRIRRSLKPKRVTLVTEVLEPVVEDILALNLGCPVILNDGKPFAFGASASQEQVSKFRQLCGGEFRLDKRAVG